MGGRRRSTRRDTPVAVRSARPEQTITGITKTRKDVAVCIEFTVKRCGNDRNVRMCRMHPAHPGRGCHKTEKPYSGCSGVFQPGDRGDRASTGCQHRIEQNEFPLCRVGRNLEVVINRLECFVVAIQPDVADARRWDQPEDSVDHAEAGPENRYQHKLLPGHTRTDRPLEGRRHLARFERKIGRRVIGHQHRDFVNKLLENLRWRIAVTQQSELVLNQWMASDCQARHGGGGGHGVESSNFAAMKEYQAVIVRLSRRVREDEDAITDLLNERSRGGWQPELMTQDAERVTVVFSRRAESGR